MNLKYLVHHEVDETQTKARASLFEYIEVFYNRERRHSSLGYLLPPAANPQACGLILRKLVPCQTISPTR